MTLDEHYICQRAANAIISEIGPFRVSTDALQAINQFLDEFIVLLLTCSLSLDLSQIKSVVFSLLPSTLGKNAIVEAELEVKTFTETESIDYELYERMRNLGEEGDGSKFPLEEAVPLLREKCFEYCTLADKDDQLYLQNSIRKKARNEAEMKVIISPIVAIYVTTVMEHIAEYLLTAVAMTAEHEETDYVRVKEVFLALIDDIQLGDVFNRMDLRDKMEKRAGLAPIRARTSYLSPPSPMMNNNRKSYTLDHPQNDTGSFLDITFDDLDLDYFEENPRKSTASRIPPERPQSAMSHSSQYSSVHNLGGGGGNRKSTFHLFKNNRNSFSGGDVPPRASSPIASAASVYDPDGGSNTTMNFDELIKSGGTVKVSLTPNRLRSIEIKDTKKDELTPPTWERRSTSTSPRLSAAVSSRPSSPLVRQNSTKSNNSKKSTTSAALGSHSEEMTIEVPKINTMRPGTPSSPLGKKSFSVNEKSKFENPRDAPKPPTSTPLSPTISVASISSSSMVSKTSMLPPPILNRSPVVSPTNSTTSSSLPTPPATIKKTMAPLPKLTSPPQAQVSYIKENASAATAATTTKKAAIPSTHSSDSISSEISSVPSIPSPITSTPPPPSDTLSSTKSTNSSTTISIQEPPIPRPTTTKSIPLNTNGMVIRRSSVSNKKSRDNLRSRVKEEQLQQQQKSCSPLNDEPMPSKTVMEAALLQQESMDKKQEEEVEIKKEEEGEEENSVLLTEEPTQIESVAASRQVRFDDAAESASITTTELNAATTTTDEQAGDENNTTATAKNEQEENADAVGAVIPRVKKVTTLSPERPSSMVAKRASMVGNNRRRSLHENYAAEKYHQDVLLRHRVSTVGSVSVSIKQWDDILKPNSEEQQMNVIPPAAHRRSVLRQLRQQQLKEQSQLQQEQQQKEGGSSDSGSEASGSIYLNNSNNNSNAVLDKVLKFERASSLDDVAHQRVSHMPRRERFLYLQQDPSAIERKSTITTATTTTTKTATALTRATPSLLKRHIVGIDQGIQTDPTQEEPVGEKKKKKKEVVEDDSSDEEEGEVDGDEEWFLQDDEWDEQEETAIVEWLLGE